jgi:hypothetical protein
MPSTESLTVLCCTWNCGNAAPPKDLSPWVPAGGGKFDIIVIALQECTFQEKKKKKSDKVEEVAVVSPKGKGKAGKKEETKPTPAEEEEEEEEGEDEEATGDVEEGEDDLSAIALSVQGSKAGHPPPAPKAAAAASTSLGDLSAAMQSAASAAMAVLTTCAAFDNAVAFLGPSYTLITAKLMFQIGLMVFAKPSVAATISELEVTTEATGLLGITPNKGGVVVKFSVGEGPGAPTLAFVGAHLAAHMKHVEHRNLNSVEILNYARMGVKEIDVDAQFSHVFFMGDLNYRIDLAITAAGRERGKESPAKWAAVQALIKAEDWDALYECDQLQEAREAGLAFTGFEEAPLAFPPTFKVKKREVEGHSEQRISSWCDRVMWRSLPGLAGSVVPLAYTSHPSIVTSDHKPVSCGVRIHLPAQLPLAALRFPLTSSGKPSTAASTLGGGCVLRLSELAGHGLLGMDVTGKSDVYCLFYSDRELLCARPGKTPKATTQRQTVDPTWRDDEVDDMRVCGRYPSDLSTAHLFMVIMDKDLGVAQSDRMGQAVLCLKAAAYARGEPVPFALPVTKGGRTQGSLTGLAMITWPQDADSTASLELRARRSRSWLCC